MRDDFLPSVRELLAKRVGYRCSNPGCRQPTSGPQEDQSKVVNVGVASHITAASADGPRYDPSLTPEQRKAPANGIWLCQKCGKLVDNDPIRYTVENLLEWKRTAEETAIREIEGNPKAAVPPSSPAASLARLERMMPQLLAEMKKDLAECPFRREFVLLKKTWSYWEGGDELMYYFEDHAELEGQMQILVNLGLIEEITYNNVRRFVITEEFATYLTGEHA